MKDPTKTPNSRLHGMLRTIFLKSRERTAALKRDNYTCQICGKKSTTKKGQEVKVQVHHVRGFDEKPILSLIKQNILCQEHLEDLQTLCVDCHDGIKLKPNIQPTDAREELRPMAERIHLD